MSDMEAEGANLNLCGGRPSPSADHVEAILFLRRWAGWRPRSEKSDASRWERTPQRHEAMVGPAKGEAKLARDPERKLEVVIGERPATFADRRVEEAVEGELWVDVMTKKMILMAAWTIKGMTVQWSSMVTIFCMK